MIVHFSSSMHSFVMIVFLLLGEAVAVSAMKFTVFGMTERISEIRLNSLRKSEPLQKWIPVR